VALWLDNSESREPGLAQVVNTLFEKEALPSYKYIVVLHQLSARLNENSLVLTEKLTKILSKRDSFTPFI
jgi:hypothetical protein